MKPLLLIFVICLLSLPLWAKEGIAVAVKKVNVATLTRNQTVSKMAQPTGTSSEGKIIAVEKVSESAVTRNKPVSEMVLLPYPDPNWCYQYSVSDFEGCWQSITDYYRWCGGTAWLAVFKGWNVCVEE